ncbi:hypothetical protein [Nocardia gipuzkoensis]
MGSEDLMGDAVFGTVENVFEADGRRHGARYPGRRDKRVGDG